MGSYKKRQDKIVNYFSFNPSYDNPLSHQNKQIETENESVSTHEYSTDDDNLQNNQRKVSIPSSSGALARADKVR